MRVGIVGAGTMASVHATGWKHTDAELVGITSKNHKAALELSKKHTTKTFDTYESLLEQVDIIDICTPTDFHKEMVLQAAAAGKHIICEKPIALTTQDGEAMIEACAFVYCNGRSFLSAVQRGAEGGLEWATRQTRRDAF
jgi:myo-inositol 2-dehydrogenase / D-chiro-inositol 1-dehydrogenase